MFNTASAAGWVVAAAVSGALSVLIGAFAAHGLDPLADAKAIGWLHTGSLYAAMHALAITAVVALASVDRIGGRPALFSQWFFLVGSAVFPGALYGLALHGPRWLGAIAPIGGAAFVAGWVLLGVAAWVRR